ncbi:MAG: ABC transporter ATP-binding protein [Chthoniobacterales bacterium]
MDAPLLALENVSVRRGSVEILRGIDWTMRPGEHWVILGANGSGKTSLLAALTGYLSASEGTISLLGRTFGTYDWRELRKRVGLVSSSVRQRIPDEEEGQMTVLSGREAMVGHWGKVKKAELQRAQEILERLGCESLAWRPWLVLSQGERQKILIGRALMAEPDLLILDEPCAGLDPVAREDFLQHVELLARSENAPGLVLVTHHVEEITPGFSHVLLLQGGRVLHSGPKKRTLTSAHLAATFQRNLRLTQRGGRYHLAIAPEDGVR